MVVSYLQIGSKLMNLLKEIDVGLTEIILLKLLSQITLKEHPNSQDYILDLAIVTLLLLMVNKVLSIFSYHNGLQMSILM